MAARVQAGQPDHTIGVEMMQHHDAIDAGVLGTERIVFPGGDPGIGQYDVAMHDGTVDRNAANRLEAGSELQVAADRGAREP